MSRQRPVSFQPISRRVERGLLGAIVLLFVGLSIVGITWGLPSRRIDPYLFGGEAPWSGEEIYRLAGPAEKFSPMRGADVDVDPLEPAGDEPVLLTGTEEDVAKIYLRYRLYTYQPDEMITMMALAGMRPRQLRLDPRLYQYGGLFIYPVGVLIGLGGLVGMIDLRSEVAFYLDHPEEFGKFYIVARAYSAVWGTVGVLIVFAIGRRLGGSLAGLLAALLFTLMPVVVCMAHEGKPHLPGAVLMLAAVFFAMRHLALCGASDGQSSGSVPCATQRDWRLMCVGCGAALGMVLSSWPIFVLIPLVATLERGCQVQRDVHSVVRGRALPALCRRTSGGVLLGLLIYLLTNPYVLINVFFNREVLRSNLSNSLAMYEAARVGEGFLRVVELTVEGATLPVAILGVVALVCVLMRATWKTSFGNVGNVAENTASRGLKPAARTGRIDPVALPLVLLVPGVVFFGQFVLIGAGKPGEYGRFGIFPDTALAIGAACVLTRRRLSLREIVNWLATIFVLGWTSYYAANYAVNYQLDATGRGSRMKVAQAYQVSAVDNPAAAARSISVTVEPAPYSCPPLAFSVLRVFLAAGRGSDSSTHMPVRIEPVDHADAAPHEKHACLPGLEGGFRKWPFVLDAPITWANKPFRRDCSDWGLHDESGTAPRPMK